MFIKLFFIEDCKHESSLQKLQLQANKWIADNKTKMNLVSVDTKFTGTGSGSSGSHGKLGIIIQILYNAEAPIEEDPSKN